MNVTPFAGVWIEIYERDQVRRPARIVTPFAGVWIEIISKRNKRIPAKSLPSRECGLKLRQADPFLIMPGHSLRGSVD